jgi:uncharacterized surface protein with fasciclin (FAS1) repeats
VNRESTLRASRKGRTAIAVGALLSLGLAACTTDANDAITTTTAAAAGASTTTTETPLPMGDIVATALTGHVFTELAGLALDAGLVDTLRGGPFTVFAPTDAAFAKVPVPVLHAIQDNADLLKSVLLHHVVPGTITPDQLAAGELTTAAGDKLAVTKVGDKFYVDGNEVGAAVQATNGYVYVMSDVLVPAIGDIPTIATTLPGFSTLVKAVSAAGLVETLKGAGPFTVFAPVDDAFAAVPSGTLNSLLADPKGALTKVLTYHVVAGKLNADQLVEGTLKTVEGEDLTVTKKDGVTYIDGNPIVVQNVQASNGVIQVLGAVLLPPSMK